MRILIILFLISILPIQEIKADISIDSIKSAEELYTKFGQNNINKAIGYYQDILSSSESVNETIECFCLLQLGTLHYYIRDLEKAKIHLNQCRNKIANSLSTDPNILSRILTLSSQINFITLKYKETLYAVDSAIFYQKTIFNPDSLMLCDLNFLKAGSHKELGNYKLAIEYFKRSLNLLNTSSSKQSWRKANIYKSIGSTYKSLGLYRLALRYFYDALIFYNPKEPNDLLASTYYYIGSINSTLGDYKLAEENLKKTIEIYDQIYQGKHINYSYYYNSLGSIYRNLAEIDSAFLYYHKSISTASDYNIKTISNRYSNLAKLYFENNDLVNAKKYFNKSIKSADSLLESMSIQRGSIYQNAAKYYIETNNLIKGFELLDTAFKITYHKADERKMSLAYCNHILSNYHLKKDQYKKALTASQNSLIAISNQFKDSEFLSNPSHLDAISKNDLYYYLLWKAEIVNKGFENNELDTLQRLQIQKNALLTAVDVSNSMRLSLLSLEGKYWLAANNKKVYHLLIQNAIKLYSFTNEKEHLNAAIEASESSKSGILLDLIKDAKMKDLNHLPDSIIIQEQQLIDNKTFIEFEIYNTVNSNDNSKLIDSLQNELFRAKQQIEAFKTFISQNFKSFNQAIFKIDHLSIDLIQRQLNNNQIILEYYLFEKNLYTIMISKTEIQLKEIKITEAFYDNIDLFCNYTRSPELATTIEEQNLFKESSNQLYLKLIKPFKELIEGKELIIIPDDVLLNLPFEVLISDLNDSNTSSPQYLIKSNPIHYSYSSAFLTRNYLRNKFKRDTVLAFIPCYKYDDFKNTSNLKILPALKHTITEVEKIGEYYPTKIFNAEDASIENFKNEVKQFSIIHLAMHSEIENENPSFSKLVFSPNSSKEFNLYTNEIYNLDLNTNLIILSACNTGSGKIHKGEGIMSFARAFLYAGCPSLTLTLWTINDKTSSVLMGNFYKYLSKGLNKSKALQLAKLEYLKTADPLKSHPYFWAAYIQIGNDLPIKKANAINTNLILLSIAILFILIYFLRVRLKKKNKKQKKRRVKLS